MTRADRINALGRLNGARRYLEIGVSLGETFLAVEIPFRVGVDPCFRFDTAAHADAATHFVPTTSDAFFRSFEGEAFDLIYIDGLHTFDQATRDFFQSQALAHDATIWLIDDTVPNDAFSADPDQDRCYRLRRQAGGDDWSWMGDVFKTVFLIERALPRFHFRTFGGHGQTVVWREAEPRTLASNGPGLERIGSLSYLDLLDHQDVLMIESDDAIHAAIAKGLTARPARPRRRVGRS